MELSDLISIRFKYIYLINVLGTWYMQLLNQDSGFNSLIQNISRSPVILQITSFYWEWSKPDFFVHLPGPFMVGKYKTISLALRDESASNLPAQTSGDTTVSLSHGWECWVGWAPVMFLSQAGYKQTEGFTSGARERLCDGILHSTPSE